MRTLNQVSKLSLTDGNRCKDFKTSLLRKTEPWRRWPRLLSPIIRRALIWNNSCQIVSTFPASKLSEFLYPLSFYHLHRQHGCSIKPYYHLQQKPRSSSDLSLLLIYWEIFLPENLKSHLSVLKEFLCFSENIGLRDIEKTAQGHS